MMMLIVVQVMYYEESCDASEVGPAMQRCRSAMVEAKLATQSGAGAQLIAWSKPIKADFDKRNLPLFRCSYLLLICSLSTLHYSSLCLTIVHCVSRCLTVSRCVSLQFTIVHCLTMSHCLTVSHYRSVCLAVSHYSSL